MATRMLYVNGIFHANLDISMQHTHTSDVHIVSARLHRPQNEKDPSMVHQKTERKMKEKTICLLSNRICFLATNKYVNSEQT